MEYGDRVRIERATTTYEGVVLPSSTESTLVLKREGGYNVGIDREGASVSVLESEAYPVGEGAGEREGKSEVTIDESLPTVALISTGGTIASTVDYRTGAVTARFDAEDVLRAIPELSELANYRGRVVSNILSENMRPAIWQDLAAAIEAEIEAGVDGIVVMHGTDTMQYSASAISFMLETPVPIVFTGSQRSADRPSSDNVMNAICAVTAATSDIAEVMVCMHDSMSDDRCSLHRGTRVRKNHTSRRDAFETVGTTPLGWVDYETRTIETTHPYTERGATTLASHRDLETDVELLYFAPGTLPERLDALEDPAGIVLAGTGLGHVSTDWIDRIEALVERDTPVVMTSQCLDGRVCDRVYDTGRDLLDAGVIEAEDMLPETAMVKLMWALGNGHDVAETMTTNIVGEFSDRSTPWI